MPWPCAIGSVAERTPIRSGTSTQSSWQQSTCAVAGFATTAITTVAASDRSPRGISARHSEAILAEVDNVEGEVAGFGDVEAGAVCPLQGRWYIAWRSGSRLLQEGLDSLPAPSYSVSWQWLHDQFAPVAAGMDRLFEAAGWLVQNGQRLLRAPAPRYYRGRCQARSRGLGRPNR